MQNKLVNWNEFEQTVEYFAQIIFEVENYSDYVIYGKPRGGLALALALSHRTGLKMIESINDKLVHKLFYVDDIIDTGGTFLASIKEGKLHTDNCIALFWHKREGWSWLGSNADGNRPHVFSFQNAATNDWIVYPWENKTDLSIRSDMATHGHIQEEAAAIEYPVNDYYVSIQGEGQLTGTSMIILRLHGCGVGCHFCDTKETWELQDETLALQLHQIRGKNPDYTYADGDTIAKTLRDELEKTTQWQAHNVTPYVLLTGGEPADYDLSQLVAALHVENFFVALETSGTAKGHLDADIDHVCVSPKFGNPSGLEVYDDVLLDADEVKFVVGKQADIDLVLSKINLGLIDPTRQVISLQPMSQGQKATTLCIEACKKWGFNLSVQVHQYIAVP